MKILRALSILTFICTLGCVLWTTPPFEESVYAQINETQETSLTIQDICVEGYRWNVFINRSGNIINVAQAFVFDKGGLNVVPCEKNPDKVRVKKK